MRIFLTALLIWTATLSQAQTALGNCQVVDRMDTLLAVQSRLSRGAEPIFLASDLRIIRYELARITEQVPIDRIDSTAIPAGGRDILRFLANTNRLLETSSADDPTTVDAHFTKGVRDNLQHMSTHLAALRCSEEELLQQRQLNNLRPIDTEPVDESSEDVIALMRQAAADALTFTNMLIGLALVLFAIGIGLTMQKHRQSQRRRAQRFATAYSTRYEYARMAADGILLDINCFGSKLRHAETDPLSIGDPVKVFIDNAWIEGTVAWNNTHYAGVQFKKPISTEMVNHVRDTPIAPPTTQNGAQEDAVSKVA